METKELVPLRDLIVQGSLDSRTYHLIREQAYARDSFRAEVEGLAADVAGDAVRKAFVEDLLGNRAKALDTLAAAAGNPVAAYWHGYLLLEEGRTAVAADLLEKAAKKHPGQDDLKSLLVEALALSGRHAEARALFDSLGLAPSAALTAYLDGVVLEREGEYAQALAAYERAVAKENDPRFNFRLGYLAALHGTESRAIRAYEECMKTTPVFVRAAVNLGILYEDQERYHDATRVYSMVLDVYPDHERVALYLGDVEASLDMYYDREKEKERSRRKQLLQIPVTDFELSVRSRNCLAKMNIHTLGDLIQKTEAELLSYKNFGETSLAEIKKILAQKGFRLGQGLEDKPRASVAADPEKSSLLAEPVSVLELSSRAQRCMDRLGIETLADLVKRTELELINQRNFGVTSLNEVKRKLKERSLSLASG
ncbi:MAG: DNA-directed RNA polymerase subunit alpha C-terminal domain-containing protein [Planctomycetota bacterium]